MAISNRMTCSWTDGGNGFSGTITTAPVAEMIVNATIPASAVNEFIAANIVLSRMISCFIMPTGGDMTLKTNSGGSPAATISLKDGQPLVWNSTGGYPAAGPFGSTDVTSFYLTSTSGGSLAIAVGVNAAP